MGESDRTSKPVVLLTGGTGFVGSRLAGRIARSGLRVRAIVRTPGIEPALSDPMVEEIAGDFTSPGLAASAARGVDAVVHCAAGIGPELEAARQVNTEGTRAMVSAALAASVRRYIQISTISVYSRTLDSGDSGEKVLDEGAPLKDEGDPYGLTKAEADRAVLDAMKRGLRGVILRPGAILGVHRTSTWAVKMPARIRDGQVQLRGDGRELLPFVHVENLVDAVMLAMKDDRAVGRAYNVADRDVAWREYTDEVRGWFGAPPLASIPEAEFGGYWMGRFEASRIGSELGYRPRRTYAEGMAEAAEHWARERAAKS